MWGTPFPSKPGGSPVRFTPTHVGNTFTPSSRTNSDSVHPHACGEHVFPPFMLMVAIGSPPRMWGTRRQYLSPIWVARFTPTHVGNTESAMRLRSVGAVHPHACGEHLRWTMLRYRTLGSPPRMWGTPVRTLGCTTTARFTPTHVGNTIRVAADSAASTVHPHACGEHWGDAVAAVPEGGSPPRMWGTPSRRPAVDRHVRFTPTHVGNTARHLFVSRAVTVHPHACGEHKRCAVATLSERGSPPRMWGTLVHCGRRLSGNRFTPTHVGNTCLRVLKAGACTVHPHACGEHPGNALVSSARRGSPPRMWGTLFSVTQHCAHVRFTPTHVGNTR